MITARDKLTGLIRHAIEDKAGLELVTSPGRPTPRGGHDTTWMFAQINTATRMTIEVAWYHASASFTLSGPAVEQADEAVLAALGLRRSRKRYDHGPLQCELYVPFDDGPVIDRLVAALPALAAQNNPAEPLPEDAGPGRPAVQPQDDASGKSPERRGPGAPGPADGQAFTGPAGTRTPGKRDRRKPAGSQARPRGQQ